jgi:hypothetical protein
MACRDWLKLVGVLLLIAATVVTSTAEGGRVSKARFERNYSSNAATHLSLSNIRGTISVSSWNKPTVSVRANCDSSGSIQDRVFDDRISIWVTPRAGRADFEVFVPAETRISLKNVMGDVEVRGLIGHLSVSSFDSDVRIVGSKSLLVDVRVITGDIFFEGELQNDGSYNLQTTKGDIEANIPSGSSFSLTARALSENINLGAFSSSFTRGRGSKGVSGKYLSGGPKLVLTTYAGHVLLHKKEPEVLSGHHFRAFQTFQPSTPSVAAETIPVNSSVKSGNLECRRAINHRVRISGGC